MRTLEDVQYSRTSTVAIFEVPDPSTPNVLWFYNGASEAALRL